MGQSQSVSHVKSCNVLTHLYGGGVVRQLFLPGGLLPELHVDRKGLLVQLVLLGRGDFRDVRAVEVVETVHILHHLG